MDVDDFQRHHLRSLHPHTSAILRYTLPDPPYHAPEDRGATEMAHWPCRRKSASQEDTQSRIRSETTATILSGTTYYLLTHPHVMETLKKEIRGTFSSPDEINIARVGPLTYINAVLDESFRLYPPAAGSHPRITPPEGARILGEWLPGNVTWPFTTTHA